MTNGTSIGRERRRDNGNRGVYPIILGSRFSLLFWISPIGNRLSAPILRPIFRPREIARSGRELGAQGYTVFVPALPILRFFLTPSEHLCTVMTLSEPNESSPQKNHGHEEFNRGNSNLIQLDSVMEDQRE